MSTIREQVVVAAVAVLAAGRPAEVPAPVRTRLESPRPDQLPAFTVYQGGEIVSPMREPKNEDERTSRGAVVRRALDLKIEVVVKATDAAADATADPLLAWVTSALVGAGKLGGLLNDPADEAGTVFEYEQGEFLFCRATMTFRLHYQSKTADAEAMT